jgi:hypothetical protein
MPKVLIITYYWPPCGGSAVLRWLKFTKYLGNYSWEPVIYTPENPEPQENDESLLKDVPENITILRTRIWEPYRIYKWLTGKKPGDKLGVAFMSKKKERGPLFKLSLWIRSNLFIPDPRIFWIRPSIRFISRYLDQNPADVIITTGPPHSMHLIGLGLKRKLGIKWVADFRDPWTNIDFYRDMLLTRLADKYHKSLERNVLREADLIITVSPGMTHEFKNMGIKNVYTITNGYDDEPVTASRKENERFTILHLGSMPGSRNPVNLWQALSGLVKENEQFASLLEISLIGKVDFSVQESISQFGLRQYLAHREFVPHEQTFTLLLEASVLLLCINNTPNAKGILTNKFFEYLSAKRPILALGPVDGDASAILAETGAGKIFGYGDTAGLKSHLLALFELYSQHNLTVDSKDSERFSRKSLTRELSEILKSLIS